VTVAAITVAAALAGVIGRIPGWIVAFLLTAGVAYLLFAVAMAKLKAAK
jgi:predicted MFS family arabinose efflux permease